MSISQLFYRSISALVTVFLLFLTSSVLNGQCNTCPTEQVGLIYSADNLTPHTGEEICYTITVNNFESQVIFLFSINFSSSSLELTSINTVVSTLPSFTATSISPPFGPDDLDIIRVLWSGPGTMGSCLDDGTTLMEVCFEVIGNPGDPLLFDINNNGFNGSKVEFISEDSTGMTCAISNETPVDMPLDSNALPMSVEPDCMGIPQLFSRSVCGSQPTFSDGLVELNVLCGTGPYQVNISNGTSFVSPDSIILVDSLPMGNYSITVTDNDGLTSAPFDLTIDASTPLDVTAVIRPPRCTSDESGSIILSVTGGIPYGSGAYRFNWDNELFGIGVNENITLGNGVYPVTIQDSIGCTLREEFTLQTEDPSMRFNSVRDPFCDLRSNGQIVVEGLGGTPFDGVGYNFVLTGTTIDGTEINRSSTQTLGGWPFGGLTAGNYVIGVEDSLQSRSGNCPFIFSDTIQLSFSRDYTLDITGGDATGCTSGGRAHVVVSSTNPPSNLNYQITDDMGMVVATGSATSTTFDTDCLPGGMYTISIDDGQGCATDTTFNLIACTLAILPIEEPPLCDGETGTITLNATSDSLPIAYMWSNGDTTDRITDLVPGTYDVIITDAANCTISSSFIVDPAELFTIDFTAVNPTCPNDLGMITAEPNGGFDPYIYTWDPDTNGVDNPILANIPPGTYRVTIEDDDGCITVDSFTLSSLTPPVSSISNITTPRCEGDPSGAVVVTVTPNADFTGPFDFISSSGQMANGFTFSVPNLRSGNNWVVYTDRTSGCLFDTVYVDIPVAEPLSIDPDRTVLGEVDCFGGQGLDGATVNLVAEQAGVQFTWPDGDITNVKLGLSAGTYLVTLTSGQCLSVDTVVVFQPDSLEVFVDNTLSVFPSCGGDQADVVIGVRGGADGPRNYTWENASGNLVSTDTFANNLTVGDYFVTVIDANGCDAVLPFRVDVATPVVAILDEIVQPACFGETGVISIDTAFGGAGNYRFQVNTSPAQDISMPFNTLPGDYTIRVFDSEGCSFDTMVTIITPQELVISAGPDIEIELGETAALSVNITNGTPIDTIIWTANTSFNCVSSDCSSISTAPTTNQVYTVEVIDINGCVATDDILVRVVRSLNVYVPNVFSPNGADARNRDVRVFTGAGVQVIDYIRIYDRWGNLVHLQENMAPSVVGAGSWDGTFRGKELDSGVYVYVLQVRFDGETEPTLRKGDITLIR